MLLFFLAWIEGIVSEKCMNFYHILFAKVLFTFYLEVLEKSICKKVSLTFLRELLTKKVCVPILREEVGNGND